MFILQVTSTFLPSINGVAIAVEKISEDLLKKGHKVLVIAPDNLRKKKTKNKIVRYPSISNPIVKDYPLPLYPNLKKIIKIIGNQKPDIVHVHTPFYVGDFAKKLATHYNIPLVFTYHTRYGDYSQNYLRFLPGKIKEKIITKIVDDFCQKADLVIANSESIQKELIKKYPNTKITNIPTGLLTIPKINLSKQEIRKLLGLPEDKKIALVVCRIAREKNIPLLIKSIKELSDDYLLVIIGGGEYQTQLQKMVLKEKLSNKVKFFGPIEHHKLGIFYQMADFFVYSSITETQGLIFLEALSFALPIVAVDCEAAREWVLPGGGLLAQNNPKDFASKIEQLQLLNKNKITKKTQEITSKFNGDNMVDHLLNEYCQIKNF